ncbi:MAG: ankyrin repeat domain-containing protein [Bacteroidota bacterium]
MQVNTQGSSHEYASDYSKDNPKWKVKLRDAFTIADVGGKKCFIKRFEKKPDAWHLLLVLKGKKTFELPQVFDAIEVKEKGKTVYYLFQQFIPGKTLKEAILDKDDLDIDRILANISHSLSTIHQYDFWFGDFNEENIYCADDGRYILIDIDSCWAIDILPSPVMHQKGYISGQEFANTILNIYRANLNLNNVSYESIKGNNLNVLQLVALLAKLDYYKNQKAKNQNFIYIRPTNFRNLHNYIYRINPKYIQALFEKALKETIPIEYIGTLSKMIIGTIKRPQTKSAIKYFKANSTKIVKGNQLTLEWSVEEVKEVKIYAGKKVLVTNPSTNSYSLEPEKTDTYILEVTDKDGVVENSAPIQVMATAPVVPLPIISAFLVSANAAQNQKEISLKKGKRFILSWKVANASQIFLSSVGEVKTKGQKSIRAKESREYKLTAVNRQGKKVAKTVAVTVEPRSQRWVVFVIIFMVLLLAFLGFFFDQRSKFNQYYDRGWYNYNNENYISALENFQTAENYLFLSSGNGYLLRDRMRATKRELQGALLSAVIDNEYNEVNNLLKIGMNPHIQNINNTPLITLATYYGDLKMVKLLIENPYSYYDKAKCDDTRGCFSPTQSVSLGSPIATAAYSGNFEVLKYLVGQCEVYDAKQQSTNCDNTLSLLEAALRNNNTSSLGFLLEEIDFEEDEYKDAFLGALRKNQITIANTILKYSEIINANITAEKVNLRSYSSPSSTVKGSVNRGNRVRILEVGAYNHSDSYLAKESHTININNGYYNQKWTIQENTIVKITKNSISSKYDVKFKEGNIDRHAIFDYRNYLIILNDLENMRGKKWYKIKKNDGKEGWVFEKFIQIN